MAEQKDKQKPSAMPGFFQDLVSCLKSLKSDYDSVQLEDCSFTLSVEEFHYFIDLIPDIPCKLGRFAYHEGILYFKNMGTIHEGVTAVLHNEINNQLQQYATHPVVGTIVTNSLMSLGSRPVLTGQASYRKPDFSFGGLETPLPAVVGEVSYSRNFRRQELAKYQTYLTESDGKICTVICVDLYYAKGLGRELKTAAELDRSAISVWTVKPGDGDQVTTVMDWRQLS